MYRRTDRQNMLFVLGVGTRGAYYLYSFNNAHASQKKGKLWQSISGFISTATYTVVIIPPYAWSRLTRCFTSLEPLCPVIVSEIYRYTAYINSSMSL